MYNLRFEQPCEVCFGERVVYGDDDDAINETIFPFSIPIYLFIHWSLSYNFSLQYNKRSRGESVSVNRIVLK